MLQQLASLGSAPAKVQRQCHDQTVGVSSHYGSQVRRRADNCPGSVVRRNVSQALTVVLSILDQRLQVLCACAVAVASTCLQALCSFTRSCFAAAVWMARTAATVLATYASPVAVCLLLLLLPTCLQALCSFTRSCFAAAV
jgi:hypothetical protein